MRSANGLIGMKVIIKWHDTKCVRFSAEQKNSFLWDETRQFFPGHEPLGPESFVVAFHEMIAVWRDVYGYLSNYNVAFDVESRLIEDVRRFREAQKKSNRNFTTTELRARLLQAGFKRELKEFQEENVCKLARRNQGATFSVPGAGKTTEALAFFYSTAEPTDKLLVVAPINAFGSWDEQLQECTKNCSLSFVRLTGGTDNIARRLLENHRFLLINYEALRNFQTQAEVCQHLKRDSGVYVFLDESHKIKNEKTSQAEAIRLIQAYPKAKLIMSGTPMPQGPKDLLPQYRFLFPDESVTENTVIGKFQSIYVRTTAHRLGIKDIVPYRKNIELDDVGKILYKRMRNITLEQVGRPSQDARFLRNLGKSVMRLLAFVSNPALAAHYFSDRMPELSEYLRTSDSQKISYVCKRARQLASQKKKVLIWSSFVRNVELISTRLQDIGADYIHGGVPQGSADEPNTREWKIRRFHEPGTEHMVLVANPAAASEGISLHKACQYAIYLDRSFNAAHFLQSQDRIHRLDMPPNTVPEMEFVMCPNTIDETVEVRLAAKIQIMGAALNDMSIIPTDPEIIYDDVVEDGPEVDDTSSGLSQSDVAAIIEHLKAI